MRHNKKRNAAIIYEQLVRFISKALIEGETDKAREAMFIVQEHFKPGTHLHKEFKLFNALVRTTVESESIAIRILDEAKKATQTHDVKALDKEKGALIHTINKKLNQKDFFEQRIPDYRSLATVQTLMNDWRNILESDLSRIAEYEQKVIKMLLEEKKTTNLEKKGVVNNLSLNIMKKKVSEKISRELTTEQFRLIKLALAEDKQNLVPLLDKIKQTALLSLKQFEKLSESKITLEKVKGVRAHIDELSTEDIREENISKFLVLNKLIEEIRGEENAGRR
jgi:hypothetical protein